MTKVEECKNIVAEHSKVSPCMFDSLDDFEDEYLADAKRIYGKMNAAQRSAVEKMARDDWGQYHNC